ncbi:MAG: class I tRNA ligase family protein, partial [Candidatus Paceibacterota bacterium]
HWWPADVHVIGKGILRFHAVYWPAFLMSAKLALPKSIFVHGYVTVEGQKMSKTVGNVVDPFQLISKYGADPVRYYLLREIPTTGDGDFSRKRFKQIYTSDLANGLGNLVQRVSKLCQLNNIGLTEEYRPKISDSLKKGGYKTHLDRFELSLAFEEVWRGIKVLDIKINTDEPWNNPNAKKIRSYAKQLLNIAYALKLFLPDTSKKISEIFSRGKIIAPKKPLFPRL